jgi:hypothetical protein
MPRISQLLGRAIGKSYGTVAKYALLHRHALEARMTEHGFPETCDKDALGSQSSMKEDLRASMLKRRQSLDRLLHDRKRNTLRDLNGLCRGSAQKCAERFAIHVLTHQRKLVPLLEEVQKR